MTDLEITKACAEAMGITGWLTADDPMTTNAVGQFIEPFDPLHDKSQAMDLVIKLNLSIYESNADGEWCVFQIGTNDLDTLDTDLLRAICTCAAKTRGKAKP